MIASVRRTRSALLGKLEAVKGAALCSEPTKHSHPPRSSDQSIFSIGKKQTMSWIAEVETPTLLI
jgi:hypothetical protein